MHDNWNRCVECGQFVPYDDFITGKATNILLTPESEFGYETYEVLCAKHSATPPIEPDKGERRE